MEEREEREVEEREEREVEEESESRTRNKWVRYKHIHRSFSMDYNKLDYGVGFAQEVEQVGL